MNNFNLALLDSRGRDDFADVIQFVAADRSGSFGVLAGHVHLVAVLRYGLARFCDSAGTWYYLALPGGVLRFCDNRLTVTTVRYFLGMESDLLCQQLAAEIAQNDSEVHAAQATLSEIEHSLIRRLAELSKFGGSGIL